MNGHWRLQLLTAQTGHRRGVIDFTCLRANEPIRRLVRYPCGAVDCLVASKDKGVAGVVGGVVDHLWSSEAVPIQDEQVP